MADGRASAGRFAGGTDTPGTPATVDERAVVPSVAKALEAAVVVALVALLTATLFGGVVPGYRSAAGAEVGDRVLATAGQGVEAAVPPGGVAVDARHRVSLPRSVRGEGYVLRADAGTESLVLDHPHPAVGGRARLALPDRVATVRGEYDSASGAPLVVAVRDGPGGLVVTLREGSS